MDDGYLIHESKEYLHECLQKIQAICDRLGIRINMKKTKIVKLTHGFRFLKARYYLTESGKVIKKIYKRSVTVERRKLKKLRRKVQEGTYTAMDVFQSFMSWRAYARNFQAFHTICNMEKLIRDLFPDEYQSFPWLSKKEIRRKKQHDRERNLCNP